MDDGWRKTCVTGDDGLFSVLVPTAGHYQLRIAARGFKPYLRTGLTLNGTTQHTLNAQLALTSENTTVEVSVDRLQIDLSDTQQGETIAATKMTSVPLNGRSFTDLVGIQPGIVPTSSQQPNAVVMSGVTSTPPSGDLNAGNVSISGQRETSNGFRVNGSDVEEDVNMGTAIVPNLDSIQEFRVLTSNFDAQYGNYSGGQVVVLTKAGSNQFHGDAFEFLRNTNFDARNYFSAQRAKFNQNQFGGTLGGPIRRDKIFFFTDYQGTRMTEGVDTGRISVPSFFERAGNFVDPASGSNTLTGTVSGAYFASLLSKELGYPVTSGEAYSSVFPDGVISQRAWSAPAKALLRYIPSPNQVDNSFSTSAYNQTLRDDKGALRIDANTGFGSVAAYYFLDDYSLNNPYPTGQDGASVPGFNAMMLGRAQLLSLSLTKALGANTLNEFHFSYMRFANNAGEPVGGVGPSLASQGFVDPTGASGIVPLAPKIEGIENVSFNDFTFGVDTTGLTQANNTFQWMDSFSKIIGKHTVKLGGEFHLDQINTHPDVIFNGGFLFQVPAGNDTERDQQQRRRHTERHRRQSRTQYQPAECKARIQYRAFQPSSPGSNRQRFQTLLRRSGNLQLRCGASEEHQDVRVQVAGTPAGSLQCLQPRPVLRPRRRQWQHQQFELRASGECGCTAARPIGRQILFLNVQFSGGGLHIPVGSSSLASLGGW
jgi:hypothetical protein